MDLVDQIFNIYCNLISKEVAVFERDNDLEDDQCAYVDSLLETEWLAEIDA